MNCLGVSVSCTALSSLLTPSRQWLENAECSEESGSAWLFYFFFYEQGHLGCLISYVFFSFGFLFLYFWRSSQRLRYDKEPWMVCGLLCVGHEESRIVFFLRRALQPCVELVSFSNRVTVVQFNFQCQRTEWWHLLKPTLILSLNHASGMIF